jgi:aquaporin Z
MSQNANPGDPVAAEQPVIARRLFAEAIGTFFLTAVAAGIEIVAKLPDSDLGRMPKAIAPALVVAAMIFAIGDVSGAHLNPAVTFAFALRGDFGLAKVPLYWAAQLAGAVLAASLLRSLFGPVEHLGSTVIHTTPGRGLVIEILLTALLVTVIINVSNKHRLLGPNAALPVGATIAACGMFGGSLTGASMNPARSFGPAIVAWHLSHLWIYVAGPAIGATCATAIAFALHPRVDDEEREAAEGSEHQ